MFVSKCVVGHAEFWKGQRTDNASNGIRIRVRSRTTILKVTVALGSALARDTDGRATVGHAVGEGVDGTGLVATSETLLVTFAVDYFLVSISASTNSLNRDAYQQYAPYACPPTS